MKHSGLLSFPNICNTSNKFLLKQNCTELKDHCVFVLLCDKWLALARGKKETTQMALAIEFWD